MAPLDLNGDGIDEFIIKTNDRQIDVQDFDFKKFYFSIIVPTGKYNSFIPLPTSSLDSLNLFYYHWSEDSAVYDLGISTKDTTIFQKKCVVFTGKDKDRDGRFDNSLHYEGMIKNRKNEQLILFGVNSASDAAKRGLLAFNLKTKKITWQFLAGPQVYHINICDYDSNGISDIFCGSYAPGNHETSNGLSDDKSYLFAIDGEGKPRWIRYFGGKWTGVVSFLLDINGDARDELVAYTYNNNADIPGRDSLVIVDRMSGKILNSYVAGERFLGSGFTDFSRNFSSLDLNSDGKDEILLPTKSGFVWMFNDRLEIIKYSDCLHDEVHLVAVADLDGDGLCEVVCEVGRHKLVVLNNELKTLATYPTPEGGFAFLAQRKNKTYIVLSQNKANNENDYIFLDFHPIYLPEKAIQSVKNYWYWLAGIIVGLLLIFWLRTLFVGAAARKLYLMSLKNAELDKNILLIYKGRTVYHIGENWKQFIHISGASLPLVSMKKIFASRVPKEARQIITKLLREKTNSANFFYARNNKFSISSNYIFALKTHALILSDTTEQEYVKQLKHWALVAQRLAHGIKNPLTTVKLNAEEMKYQLREKYKIDNEEINSFIDSIIRQVKRLKKMSDAFMRFVEFERPKWEIVDLNEELKEKTRELKASVPRKIRIEYELAENLPRVKIDREQFFHALNSVLHNAVESMEGEGRIIISTAKANMLSEKNHLPSQSKYILLQIRDTGCGIPAEFLDKVTQPFFSRNKTDGTGLGLSIVQKIIEMHGGKLEIYSQVNEGTTVSIWLAVNAE